MSELSIVQIGGALCFGIIIGWYIYYINRHRTDEIKVNDLVTVIGAIGGATVLAIFPSGTELFGYYGLGLVLGFFGYLLWLLILVAISDDFPREYFLDGRHQVPDECGNKYWVVPKAGEPGYGGATIIRTGPGGIRVVSNPKGARIYIDGTLKDPVTPHTFEEIAPGTHNVKVQYYGYFPAEDPKVVVTSCRITQLNFKLEKEKNPVSLVIAAASP